MVSPNAIAGFGINRIGKRTGFNYITVVIDGVYYDLLPNTKKKNSNSDYLVVRQKEKTVSSPSFQCHTLKEVIPAQTILTN